MSALANARRTRVVISVAHWRHNLRAMRAFLQPNVKMMAVIKADAYGHGIVPFGLAAQQERVDWIGVALAEEGRVLRQAGATLPILVLGVLNQDGMRIAAEYRLTVSLADVGSVQCAQAAATEAGCALDAHMKLDTGMGRIGANDDASLRAILSALQSSPSIKLTGAFTHLSDADGPDPAYTDAQLRRFHAFCALLPEGLLLHTAASAATLSRPDSHFGMVRPGICLYGCPPVATEVDLRPCMSIISEVVFVKHVPAGTSIGYGRTHITTTPTTVATIPAGYGDGYRRAFSAKARVLIGGVSCPILGRVCMDQFMVDASAVPGLSVGDEAVLMGVQGSDAITSKELAMHADTITYEVLLSPTPRVPRFYDEAMNGGT